MASGPGLVQFADVSRDAINSLLARHRGNPHALVQILREAQVQHGCLPRAMLADLADGLGLTLAHVEGVATFYRFFHTRPVGEYRVLFSDDITDRMLGNVSLLTDLCQRLGVERGQVRTDGRVSVDFCSCTGLCDQGPSLLINHHQVVTRLDGARVATLAQLIEARVPLADWPAEWSRVNDHVRRADVLLATSLRPGEAIAAALARGVPALLDEMKRSNLRGRGGAGFVTSMKWQLCRDAKGSEHYMVCNADEGEPGTFKDRVLLSRHPDMVFEGMTIGALAIGARHGMLYLRGEYRYLLEPLLDALQRRRDTHLLGTPIQRQPGFDFDIEIHVGAGAYVCGEESSLIESLEGKRGTPRIRSPFPAENGYLGQPTAVDNVETLCAATHIALRGGAWWAAIGTPKSTGTSVHSVSGDCDRPGIYEYPMGTSIDRILEDCGARDTQAVQVGGPSGKCLSALEFGRRIAFEDVPTAGAFMVFNRSRDMFEVARNYAGFFAEESCGFCTPCRVCTALVVMTMDKLAAGRGSRRDVDVLSDIDSLMHGTTHCGLGGAACNSLHDTIVKFRPAYERRLKSLRFEPAFDLDAELADARRLTGRDDVAAHLETPSFALAKPAVATVTFSLDGGEVPFEPGETILQAARRAGRYIPHLCWHPDFHPQGSCRVCTVKVKGRAGSACTLHAAAGLVVESNTDELNAERKMLLQMLFVEGNHFCPSCEKSGNCLLQATAYEMNMQDVLFDEFYPRRPVDASHADLLIDFNRCILCELCVRASHDVDGKDVFAIAGHGIGTHLVVNSMSGQLADTAMELTDRAASICPVGAILPKRRGFVIPIGERRYDPHTAADPDTQEAS